MRQSGERASSLILRYRPLSKECEVVAIEISNSLFLIWKESTKPAVATVPFRVPLDAPPSVLLYLFETCYLHGELWKSGKEVARETKLFQLLQLHHRTRKFGQAVDVQPGVSHGTTNLFMACSNNEGECQLCPKGEMRHAMLEDRGIFVNNARSVVVHAQSTNQAHKASRLLPSRLALMFLPVLKHIRCLVSLCPPVSQRSRLRHPASRHLHYSKFWLLSNSLVLPQELERLHVSQLSGQFFQVVVVRFQHLQVTTPAYASRVSNSRDTQKEQGVRIVHAEVVTSKPSHLYKDSLAFQCRCIRRRP